MRDIKYSKSRDNYLAQICATHYHAQIGPQDKDRVIKELVVCNNKVLGATLKVLPLVINPPEMN